MAPAAEAAAGVPVLAASVCVARQPGRGLVAPVPVARHPVPRARRRCRARGPRARRVPADRPRGKDQRMAVEIGQEAPDFELKDQHGTPGAAVELPRLQERGAGVLPAGVQPVCSGELCALREDFPEVNRDDVELLTVSVDSMFSLRVWADTENFSFSLLVGLLAARRGGQAVRRVRRGQGPGHARHVRHRQGRRGPVEGSQPDPAGARHRRLPEGAVRAGVIGVVGGGGKISRASSFGRARANLLRRPSSLRNPSLLRAGNHSRAWR